MENGPFEDDFTIENGSIAILVYQIAQNGRKQRSTNSTQTVKNTWWNKSLHHFNISKHGLGQESYSDLVETMLSQLLRLKKSEDRDHDLMKLSISLLFLWAKIGQH